MSLIVDFVGSAGGSKTKAARVIDFACVLVFRLDVKYDGSLLSAALFVDKCVDARVCFFGAEGRLLLDLLSPLPLIFCFEPLLRGIMYFLRAR